MKIATQLAAQLINNITLVNRQRLNTSCISDKLKKKMYHISSGYIELQIITSFCPLLHITRENSTN